MHAIRYESVTYPQAQLLPAPRSHPRNWSSLLYCLCAVCDPTAVHSLHTKRPIEMIAPPFVPLLGVPCPPVRPAQCPPLPEPAARGWVVNIQRCWCSVLVRLYVYCNVQLVDQRSLVTEVSTLLKKVPSDCGVIGTVPGKCFEPRATHLQQAVGRGRFAMMSTWLPHCPTWTVMTAGT